MSKHKFQVGDLVIFTEQEHPRFDKYRYLVGQVRAIENPDHPTETTLECIWYTDASLKKVISDYSNFYVSRHAPYYHSIEEKNKTPVERKCRKLWNESKWVINNPQLKY